MEKVGQTDFENYDQENLQEFENSMAVQYFRSDFAGKILRHDGKQKRKRKTNS